MSNNLLRARHGPVHILPLLMREQREYIPQHSRSPGHIPRHLATHRYTPQHLSPNSVRTPAPVSSVESEAPMRSLAMNAARHIGSMHKADNQGRHSWSMRIGIASVAAGATLLSLIPVTRLVNVSSQNAANVKRDTYGCTEINQVTGVKTQGPGTNGAIQNIPFKATLFETIRVLVASPKAWNELAAARSGSKSSTDIVFAAGVPPYVMNSTFMKNSKLKVDLQTTSNRHVLYIATSLPSKADVAKGRVEVLSVNEKRNVPQEFNAIEPLHAFTLEKTFEATVWFQAHTNIFKVVEAGRAAKPMTFKAPVPTFAIQEICSQVFAPVPATTSTSTTTTASTTTTSTIPYVPLAPVVTPQQTTTTVPSTTTTLSPTTTTSTSTTLPATTSTSTTTTTVPSTTTSTSTTTTSTTKVPSTTTSTSTTTTTVPPTTTTSTTLPPPPPPQIETVNRKFRTYINVLLRKN